MVKEGFTIKDACFGLGISRSSYYELLSKKSAEDVGDKQREKKKESELNETNRAILQKIKAIKAKHPLWDYRRVTACRIVKLNSRFTASLWGYRRVTAWLRHREFMIEGLGLAYFSDSA